MNILSSCSWVAKIASYLSRIRLERDSISLPGRLKSPHKMIGHESGIEDQEWWSWLNGTEPVPGGRQKAPRILR